MKIITRYVLKEHIGPFVFALSALTSLLLLQYIARRFGDLVGKGLSWHVIAEFFVLSVPFTMAMTLPMSVLVATLYAFSRLASENEVTALKAGGMSSRSLMRPALIASVFLAFFMLWFNDQLLPRANHELATLQMAIFRTKPTFALRPQVINTIKESQLYLRPGYIAEDQSGRMRDVTIYDVSDGNRRKTIYADSGTLAFAANRRDLSMHLYSGWMLTAANDKPGQINRIYFTDDELKIRDVGNTFDPINADTTAKGEREMSVCEMQKYYESASVKVWRAHDDSLMAVWRLAAHKTMDSAPRPKTIPKAGGIGAVYCNLITKYGGAITKYFRVKSLHAAEVPRLARQDTTKRPAPQDTAKRPPAKKPAPAAGVQHPDSVFVLVGTQYVKVPWNKIPPNAEFPGAGAAQSAGGAAASTARPVVPTPGAAVPNPSAAVQAVTPNPTPTGKLAEVVISSDVADAHMRLDEARHSRNRYAVEIQKKFSLAAACIVLVIVGAPIALRFPSGGVGVVIGVSFAVFGLYYVGLIGGESLANKNIISPVWAMWADNIVFLLIGSVLIVQMGNESVTSRGGRTGEIIDGMRAWFGRQGRRVGIGRSVSEVPT
ncbi:MAG: LptF/LptG family permease [bacterium]